MFKRDILDKLQNWSKAKKRKPLILRGARQVGKTTAIQSFGQQFPCFISLNLEIQQERKIFEQQLPVNDLLDAIFFYKKMHKIPTKNHDTILIFIDEIQNSPSAFSMLRYFYEQLPSIRIIAAGSLLETLIDNHISFPVGRVEYEYLYPLTFTEFLGACQENHVLEALENRNLGSTKIYTHDIILKLFHEYVLIGGMPEIIESYISDKDKVKLDNIYRNLLTGYEEDIEKYAVNSQQAHVIRHVMMHAPYQAGSRIKFQNFGQSQYGSRTIGEAMRILEKALILNLIYPTTEIKPPFEKNHKKSPRLQFLDTGLLNFSIGIQKDFFKLSDLNQIYQGKISEHIVGQELLGSGVLNKESLLFWVREKPQSSAEVDFVIPYGSSLIPVEVKSGKTGTLRSLHSFMDQVQHDFAIRLYAGHVLLENIKTHNGKNFRLLNLPYYLTSKINRYIEYFFEEKSYNA